MKYTVDSIVRQLNKALEENPVEYKVLAVVEVPDGSYEVIGNFGSGYFGAFVSRHCESYEQAKEAVPSVLSDLMQQVLDIRIAWLELDDDGQLYFGDNFWKVED